MKLCWWWRCLALSGVALSLSGCQSYCARHSVENQVKNATGARFDGSQSNQTAAVASAAAKTSRIQQVSHQVEQPASEPRRSLEIPKEIPGSSAAPLHLPPFDPNESDEKRRESIERLFEKLPSVPERLHVDATSEVRAMSLGELQQLALAVQPEFTSCGGRR